jgi:hypothetical protein
MSKSNKETASLEGWDQGERILTLNPRCLIPLDSDILYWYGGLFHKTNFSSDEEASMEKYSRQEVPWKSGGTCTFYSDDFDCIAIFCEYPDGANMWFVSQPFLEEIEFSETE